MGTIAKQLLLSDPREASEVGHDLHSSDLVFTTKGRRQRSSLSEHEQVLELPHRHRMIRLDSSATHNVAAAVRALSRLLIRQADAAAITIGAFSLNSAWGNNPYSTAPYHKLPEVGASQREEYQGSRAAVVLDMEDRLQASST